MKGTQKLMLGAVAAMMFAGVALAQTPMNGQSGPVAEVNRSYSGVKANILKSADEMPADGYSFKPVQEVRTYARVLNHISEAQLRSCGAVNGTKDLPKVPEETADRAAIIEVLKASFAECDKAFATLTATNFSDMFTVGKMERSRVGLIWGTVSHDNEQYATLALYLRLKGMVPPSSEK
jgi:DinB family protein